mgnify:CR=1 FL=1
MSKKDSVLGISDTILQNKKKENPKKYKKDGKSTPKPMVTKK